MKKVLFILILILLIQGVWADQYYLSVKQEGDNALVNHFVSLDEEQEIRFLLPPTHDTLVSNYNFTIEENYAAIFGQKITLSYLQPAEGSFDKLIYFLIKIDPNINFSRVVVDFFSDKDYIIKKELTSPKNFEIISDSANSIVSWNLENPTNSEMIISLESSNKRSWVYWSGPLAIFVLLIFLGSFIIKKDKKRKDYLLKDEQKVIEILKNSNRKESWQRKIQEETGFSKAKLSRMIRNLESRGLIEKIIIGNTNKIRLK